MFSAPALRVGCVARDVKGRCLTLTPKRRAATLQDIVDTGDPLALQRLGPTVSVLEMIKIVQANCWMTPSSLDRSQPCIDTNRPDVLRMIGADRWTVLRVGRHAESRPRWKWKEANELFRTRGACLRLYAPAVYQPQEH